MTKRCKACGTKFQPHPKVPNQTYCSSPECQRERRRRWLEEIRDKIAASKRKGMWMGGMPPLGYDVENRWLVPNPQESKLVRQVFQHFVELGSSTKLVRELTTKTQLLRVDIAG